MGKFYEKNHAGGCKRIITPEEVPFVTPVKKRNKNVISSQIAADLAIIIGTHNSAIIISLRLN